MGLRLPWLKAYREGCPARWDLHQETAVWQAGGLLNPRPAAHLAIMRRLVQAHPVSETADWKQKYRDSLLEMEAEEKRWREVERILRRLIGRLCAAGMGVNLQLDDELTALAAANRRPARAPQDGRSRPVGDTEID
jgi:hypothetical protein